MRKCQAEARRRCRHFPHQKKVAKEGAAPGFHSSNTPVAARPRASLSLPRESDKESGKPLDPFFCPAVFSVYQITPVAPEVRASLSLPRESDKERPGSKGRGPSAEGPPLRGRSALTGGPVPPCAPLPSGGESICETEWSKLRACGGHPAPARPLFAAESGPPLAPG